MNCWEKAAFTAVFTIPSIRKIKSDRNSGRIQTTDKGTEHEKNNNYNDVEKSGEASPRLFCDFLYFFVQNEPRLAVQRYSSRLGSSCLRSFSALCQADDKPCHQLESDRNSGRILLLKFISYNERLCSYRI